MNALEKLIHKLKIGDQAMHLSWLNKFAEGKLTKDELSAFDIFIKEIDDIALKTAYEGLKENNSVSDIDNIRQKIKNTHTLQAIDYSRFLKVAAILIMVLSLTGGYIFIQDNYFDDEVLADKIEKHKTENIIEEQDVELKRSIFKSEEKPETMDEKKSLEQERAKPESVLKPTSTHERFLDEIAIQPSANAASEEIKSTVGRTQNDNSQFELREADDNETAVGKKESSRGSDLSKVTMSRSKTADAVNFQAATYPGGMEELKKFIKTERKDCFNTTNRTVITDKDIVKLKLKIKADGTVKNIKVIKSLTDECDNEAIRIVEKMPKWIPANRNGKNVEDEVEVIVNFE